MGCHNGGVPLDRRPVGHQRIGDGLGHLGRGAVVGQLGVRVALGLVDGRRHGEGYFGRDVKAPRICSEAGLQRPGTVGAPGSERPGLQGL